MLTDPKTEELRSRLANCPVVALLRRWPPDRIVEAASAANAAGIGVFEVTLDSEKALEQIAAVRERFGGQLMVGAGTVVSPDQVREALAAGAQFVVSPHLDPAVVQAAYDAQLLAIPAVLTPTELTAATAMGSALVKVFPAGPLGADYIRALRGPYPDVGLLATGGVGASNAGSFLDAGATAVALGSSLFAANRTVDELRDGASKFVATLIVR